MAAARSVKAQTCLVCRSEYLPTPRNHKFLGLCVVCSSCSRFYTLRLITLTSQDLLQNLASLQKSECPERLPEEAEDNCPNCKLDFLLPWRSYEALKSLVPLGEVMYCIHCAATFDRSMNSLNLQKILDREEWYEPWEPSCSTCKVQLAFYTRALTGEVVAYCTKCSTKYRPDHSSNIVSVKPDEEEFYPLSVPRYMYSSRDSTARRHMDYLYTSSSGRDLD